MAGLLTHLSIALAGFIVTIVLLKKLQYGIAFVLGHLIPDLIDFGITGIIYGTLNPLEIMTKPSFEYLLILGHTVSNWIIPLSLIIVITFLLCKFGKISKPTLNIIYICLILFLIGMGIHFIADALIIETSCWI